VAPHPSVGQWLDGLSYEQRLDLDNRIATQALLDDPVTVESEAGGWAHVLVDEQRGAVYRSGIAGWVPASQITLVPPPDSERTAVVTRPLIREGGITLSYGTRLPVVATASGDLTVRTPGGVVRLAPAEAELLPRPATGSQVVTEARRFLGLPYLWAGTSGFGLDCSGLTYLIYRQLGFALPRDAADQASVGTPVAKADLRPGDLVFFAFGPTIDHVGIYAGGGLMIDAPHTGAQVEEVPLWSPSYAPAFAGARRYLTRPT
jgi:cell wall-associated NlpC family hydrolase